MRYIMITMFMAVMGTQAVMAQEQIPKKSKMLGLDLSGGRQIIGPLATINYTVLDSAFSYKIGLMTSLSRQRYAEWLPPSRLGINFSSSYHNIELGRSLHLRIFSRLQTYFVDGNLPIDFDVGYFFRGPYYPMRHLFIDFTFGAAIYKRIWKNFYLNFELGTGNSTNLRWLTDDAFQFIRPRRLENNPIITSNLGFYYRMSNK